MQAIVLETHDLEISRLLASFGAFEKYLLNYETASKKRFARMHVFSWIFGFIKVKRFFIFSYVYLTVIFFIVRLSKI